MNNNKFIVWWLSANQMKSGLDSFDQIKGFPNYIKEEFVSRYGRNGRGRLWINNEIDKKLSIPEKYWNTPLAEYLAEFCGGIVIRKSDYKYVKNFPGIFTDLKLKRI